MAKIRCAVRVKAPPEIIFELLERERTEFHNDELIRREVVGRLSFGPGYRYRSTIDHDGKPCVRNYRVTVCESPRVFEEEWQHHCHVTNRVLRGRGRVETRRDLEETIVTGIWEDDRGGLTRLWDGSRTVARARVKESLLVLGARAEALARAHLSVGAA